ncbi:Predicted sialic acid transporter [hydrothermal vent metagenome]|uniref:Predicted sialic acid transporter n=1 Tax=hydrothermal vent metagenome TaxID=652676 RepID=A0A3B1C8L5_9ZZZZ
MSGLDIAVFVIYLAGVTGVGCLFYKNSSTTDGFTSAKGRLPGWLIGLSIFGTYLSSISFLALPGKAYSGNWNAFAFSLSLPVAAWIAAAKFVPLYRQTRDISAYAYLERRFGVWARLYAMTFYLLTQFARVGTILFLVSLTLERLTGWDIAVIIVVTGILVTLYTVVGGIEAVIWTDAIQSAVLTIGAVVCAIILINQTPQGALATAFESHKYSLGSFEFDFTQSTFWVVLVYGLFINLQNFGIDQSYIQRYHTAKSLDAARRSVWIGALLYVPVSALFLFIGSALFSFYSARPELLPEMLKGAQMGDRIFPHFIVSQLPAGFTGLLIAALFAAAMSSIDSSLNSSATIVMTDVYKRFFRKEAGDRETIRFLRGATLAFGAVGTGTALAMISIKSALDVWWQLAGIFSGGMLGLFLLALFAKRARAPHAAIGVGLGLLVILWATFSAKLGLPFSNPLHALMTTVIGTMVIFIAGSIIASRRPYKAS